MPCRATPPERFTSRHCARILARLMLSIRPRPLFRKRSKLSISLAPERAELKLLYRSPRRGVLMPSAIDQFKAGSKRCGETVCVVTADDQAAAPFRAIRRERCDDPMSAR